jgi:hypothetical protein
VRHGWLCSVTRLHGRVVQKPAATPEPAGCAPEVIPRRPGVPASLKGGAYDGRDGTAGSFSMGLRHGAYCVGCCWALMALLFVVGVMNLLWVAAIALFVMAEKVLPRGEVTGHIAGVALVAAGIGVMTKFW